MAYSKGTWAATAVDSVLVPANAYRGEVTIQHSCADGSAAVFLGFGEAAVDATGVSVSSSVPAVKISGHLAALAIHGVCPAAGTAAGGYQEA